MLGSGEVVQAHRGGQWNVLLTLRVGVDQRGVASPILGRRVGEENLWRPASRRQPREQAVIASGDRVGARGVVEWKGVALGRGRGLTKALVEVAPSLTTGDVDGDAVEDYALPFVLVEAEVEKLPQIPPVLRRAEGIRPLNVTSARVAVLGAAAAQEGNGVACRQQTQPDY